jgi:PadR family transcriptional regulator, regulatory protein PadR
VNEFFRGFIKIHILHHAEEGPVFGLEMARELARHGYETISPGTLYPAFHSLEQAGYLTSERRLDGGRWRRYYALAPKGRELLQKVRRQLIELTNEVVRDVSLSTGNHSSALHIDENCSNASYTERTGDVT